MFIVLLCTMSITLSGQTYTCSATYGNSETYYLDRKIVESRARKASDPVTAGLITRAGYAFNYDAFTYGVSFYYQWSRLSGITAGFDGYYISGKLLSKDDSDTNPQLSNIYSMPLWDVRAGFMLSKYFMFGGLVGKWNVSGYYPDDVIMSHSQWFWNDGTEKKDFMYGGFVTFLMPISKHFGLNLDFAVTNKTGFNIGMGVNATIPIK